MRFRAKRDEERERGVQIVGTGACFKKRTRGKWREISSRFFFLVIFSPALLGSWLCIIPLSGFYWGTQREVGWHEGPLLSFVCFFLLLVIVTFLRFVVSSSPIRITLGSKQMVPFSPHPSPLSALPLLHVVFCLFVCLFFYIYTYIYSVRCSPARPRRCSTCSERAK